MWNIKEPIDNRSIKKVLVIKLSAHGDLLTTSAIFEPMKKALPNAKIYLLTFDICAETMQGNPFLEHIFTIPRQSEGKGVRKFFGRMNLAFHLFKEKFDVAIDFHNIEWTVLFCLFSRAKYRFGFDNIFLSFCYNYRVPKKTTKYVGLEYLKFLEPFGVEEQPIRYVFPITDESQRLVDDWLKIEGLYDKDFVIMTPGANAKVKQWSLENYAKLGDMIVEIFNYQIVLSGAPNMQEQIDRQYIYDQMKHKPYISPVTTLNQLLALFNRGKCLICNDGGANHLGCVINIKTIAIFFPKSRYLKWSPSTAFQNNHLLVNPTYTETDKSFGINPSDVISKMKEIL